MKLTLIIAGIIAVALGAAYLLGCLVDWIEGGCLKVRERKGEE